MVPRQGKQLGRRLGINSGNDLCSLRSISRAVIENNPAMWRGKLIPVKIKESKVRMTIQHSILATLLFFIFGGPAAADIKNEMDTVVVPAPRIPQHNYKLAGNVTVITQEEIAASNAQNRPEILREALGIHIYDQSTTKTSVLDMRGFGDSATRNVLVLVNDRKINNVDISGADLIQIPIDAVERIEIIRGAGSVLYGDNAVGGVVNIITKKGEGYFKGKFGGMYGSYDARATDLELSGEKSNISYYFFSKYFDQRGFRQNSDVLAKDFNTRLGYEFSDRLSMDFNVGWHKDRYGLPGGISADEIATFNRRASMEEDNYATTMDEFFELSFDMTPWPEDG